MATFEKMKSIYLQIGLAILLFTGCKNSASAPTNSNSYSCEGGEVLALVDLTGLDGCGWVFEKGNGDRLEPLNLQEKLPSPVPQQYRVLYKVRTEGASICMVGQLIEIQCIEPVN